jgi:two-component system, cell cycle response regulator DivK
MDPEMPVVDGWEATRRLKSNPQTRDIPIIALSTHALAGEREKALAAGCDEFDSKPIEFDRLVATMRRVVAPCVVVGKRRTSRLCNVFIATSLRRGRRGSRCAGLDVHKVEVVACLRLISKRKVER